MRKAEEIAEKDSTMEDEVEDLKKCRSEEVERSTKSKKQKVVRKNERAIKNAKTAAANEMARAILDIQAAGTCTTCAGLRENIASLTAELQSM